MFFLQEYESPSGQHPVTEWCDDLDNRNRARAKRFIKIAGKLDRLNFPYFKPFLELQEARWWGVNKVPHRIFCYPSDDRIIFLCGFTHKSEQRKPPNSYKTSVRRRREIEKGEATTREFSY